MKNNILAEKVSSMPEFFKALCLTLILSLCLTAGADVKVTVTGQAAGSGKAAKQQALADALRKAVQKGAGVNIISSTKATDYVLDFDRVFSRAFGYVKTFEILSSGYDKAGLFNVRISATVGKEKPELDDYMSMRQIIAMKGSPRLLIRVAGEITGIGGAEKLIDGQLREIALKCGFQTIKMSQLNEAEGKRLKRDAVLKKGGSAAYRVSGIRENYDFVIDAEVSGAYNGESELYGVTTQRFSLGADLGAVYPGGNAIAQVTIPSHEMDIAQVTDKVQAARSALHKTLGGDSGRNFRALLMRILAAWISEFDTGAKITIEFPGVSHELFTKIVEGLREAQGVNAVYIREFNEELKSIIEVESNLKAYDLGNLTSSLSGGRLSAAHSGSDFVQMTLAESYSTTDILVTIAGAAAVIILLVLITGTLKARKP
jgi:hypothetical protein